MLYLTRTDGKERKEKCKEEKRKRMRRVARGDGCSIKHAEAKEKCRKRKGMLVADRICGYIAA